MEFVGNASSIHRFGIFEVDRRTSELRRRGNYVRLQPQPFQILLLLLDHAGAPVSREQLRGLLWPGETVVDFDRNLNKAMNKLRQALGDSAENPRFIETVHRRGYRFIAPLSCQEVVEEEPLPFEPIRENSANELIFLHTREVIDEVAPASVVQSPVVTAIDLTPRESAVVAPEGMPDATITTGIRPALKVWYGLVFAVLLISIAVLSKALPMQRPAKKAVVSPAQSVPLRTVAILPFTNLSGDSRDSWIGTALSEWIATDLSSDGQLRVTLPTSVSAVGRQASPPVSRTAIQQGRSPGARYLISGTYGVVRGTKNTKVRLDFLLRDAQSGQVLASMSNQGNASDLFSLVSSAGLKLRGRLGMSR